MNVKGNICKAATCSCLNQIILDPVQVFKAHFYAKDIHVLTIYTNAVGMVDLVWSLVPGGISAASVTTRIRDHSVTDSGWFGSFFSSEALAWLYMLVTDSKCWIRQFWWLILASDSGLVTDSHFLVIDSAFLVSDSWFPIRTSW